MRGLFLLVALALANCDRAALPPVSPDASPAKPMSGQPCRQSDFGLSCCWAVDCDRTDCTQPMDAPSSASAIGVCCESRDGAPATCCSYYQIARDAAPLQAWENCGGGWKCTAGCGP